MKCEIPLFSQNLHNFLKRVICHSGSGAASLTLKMACSNPLTVLINIIITEFSAVSAQKETADQFIAMRAFTVLGETLRV